MLRLSRLQDNPPAEPMRHESSPAGVYCFRFENRFDRQDPFAGCRYGRLSALTFRDPPAELVELCREVDYVSPKQVMFFDSRPFAGGNGPGALNWVDASSAPDAIFVFLHPKKAATEIVAHELGHAWLQNVLDFEDHREYADPTDVNASFMVNCIQSSVLDCPLVPFLKARGFDATRFNRDIIKAAVRLIAPLGENQIHATIQAQVLAAGALAIPTAFSDLYELDGENRNVLSALWTICRLNAPDIAACAHEMVEALKANGWFPLEAAVRSIDGCLQAAFRFLGMSFDPSKHLVRKEARIEWLDKIPQFLPGAPPRVKHRVLKAAIYWRQKIDRALPLENSAYVEFAPCKYGFSTLGLPSIERPAPRYPAQYSREPNPMFVPGSPAEVAFIASRLALTGQPGLQVFLKDDFDLYGPKFVFTPSATDSSRR